MAVVTVLLVAIPSLKFLFFLPRSQSAIAAAAVTAALLTCALAYLKFRFTGARLWLWVSLAFLALGANQLVFGFLIPLDEISQPLDSYLWTGGRLLVAALLLAGATGASRMRRALEQPLGSFLRGAVAVLAVLSSIDGALFALREHLPALAAGAPSMVSAAEARSDPSAVAIALAATGAALYALAALAYLRPVEGERPSPWLPPALAIAAFSHIHYMLLPTVFTGFVSTGDILRLAFSGVLAAGLVWEVKRSFLAEHDRAQRLSASYEAEKARVREMEQLERSRVELFSMLTHELLHPVAAIRGLSLTLERTWGTLDEDTQREMLGQLDEATDRLRRLGDSVATVAQLEGDAFEVHPTRQPTEELVGACVDTSSIGPGLKVRLEDSAVGTFVEADTSRVLQVVLNLLSNAMKYGPGDAPVELLVEANPSSISFAVRDQGPGIPPESRDVVFQRFTRLRPPGSERVPGSGLGLYIARRIVEAHGGTIWVEDAPGGGSSFVFTLPRS